MDGVPFLFVFGSFVSLEFVVGDGQRPLAASSTAALRQNIRHSRALQFLRLLQTQRNHGNVETLHGTVFRRHDRRRSTGGTKRMSYLLNE